MSLADKMERELHDALRPGFGMGPGDHEAIVPKGHLRHVLTELDTLRTMALGIVRERDALRAEVERLTAKNAALAQELRETDEALGDYTVNIIRSLPEAAAKLRAEVERLRSDAERVAYCERHALALDFDFGGNGDCVLAIELPKSGRYPAHFREAIDEAIRCS